MTATNPRLTRLLEYLERQYQRKVTLNEVCQHLCMSASTLNRFTKKETGRTLIALLHHIRIRHAADLLRTTQDSIVGISFLTGFESPTQFNTVFKREMGMTPGKWRTLLNEE